MGNLREQMQQAQPYWHFNREERNYTALLFHALLSGQNLFHFLEELHTQNITPRHWSPTEVQNVSMYVEYALPRDLWARQKDSGTSDSVNAARRQAVLDLLQPANREQLETMTVEDWNTYFGAHPASTKWIQFPGRWQVKRLDHTISDNDAFVAACRFKWAFNIKPDLVIHLDADRAIVIEAKYDSIESAHPRPGAERKILYRRGLVEPIGQTELQEYLFNAILGIDAVHLHISRTAHATMTGPNGHAMTWHQAFSSISDDSQMMPFVKDSIASIRESEAVDQS